MTELRTVNGLELAKLLASLTGELELLQQLPHYGDCEDDCRIEEEVSVRVKKLETVMRAAGMRGAFWKQEEGG